MLTNDFRIAKVQRTLRWFEEDIPLLNMRVRELSKERQESAKQFAAALIDQLGAKPACEAPKIFTALRSVGRARGDHDSGGTNRDRLAERIDDERVGQPGRGGRRKSANQAGLGQIRDRFAAENDQRGRRRPHLIV